jgi:choline dehydrogenase-like flavoprotein
VQYRGAVGLSIPAGFFSTADLIMEDQLLDDPGYRRPLVNLNVAVWSVRTDPADARRVVGVRGWDSLGNKERTFWGRTVVLCAGTIESAKIALQSGLTDPNGLIGRGITDHTIRFRHFTLPPGSPAASDTDSAKIVLRHPDATTTTHAFDIVVELGADFNQGRYVDPASLAAERDERGNWMLGELVFMSYADLNDQNLVRLTGQPADPVEVGTLRMAGDGTGVVDADLKFLGYDNLYACDNSVFPASPAANPSLTLAALALRLASTLETG